MLAGGDSFWINEALGIIPFTLFLYGFLKLKLRPDQFLLDLLDRLDRRGLDFLLDQQRS